MPFPFRGVHASHPHPSPAVHCGRRRVVVVAGHSRAGPGTEDRAGSRRNVDRSALFQSVSQQQHRRAHLRQARADGCRLAHDPGPGDVVEAARRKDLGVQAAQGREVPRRQRTHRRGCRVLDRSRRPRFPNSPGPFVAYTKAIVGVEIRRPVHDALQDRRAASADAQRHVDDLHRVEEDRDGRRHRGLQFRQGGGRQWPLQVRALRQRRPCRARAQ